MHTPMPTPGIDCHITLQHPEVNGGAAAGLIVRGDKRGPVVEVEHGRRGLPLWADQGPGVAQVRCVVLGLPRLLAPNGGEYGLTPAQVRATLAALWAATTPLTLTDAHGSLTVAWAANGLVERRYGDGAEWEVRFVVVG